MLAQSEGGEAVTSLYPYTSFAQKWGMWPTPRPNHFTPGTDPVPIVQDVGWASEPLWRAQILPPRGFTPSNPRQVTALTVLSQLPLCTTATFIHTVI